MGMLVLALTLSTACTKEKQVCWRCEFLIQVDGSQPPPKTVCNNGEQPTFKDAAGNDLQFYCNKQ